MEKELGKLEEQKAAFDAAQAEEAKKAELEEKNWVSGTRKYI